MLVPWLVRPCQCSNMHRGSNQPANACFTPLMPHSDDAGTPLPWAWRKTAWEVALCAEGSGFDPCPPHGAFLWGNGIVIVRLAEWPVPLWGLSEG